MLLRCSTVRVRMPSVAVNEPIFKFMVIRNADFTGHLSTSNSGAGRVETEHCVVFKLGLGHKWHVARTPDQNSVAFLSASLEGFSFVWAKWMRRHWLVCPCGLGEARCKECGRACYKICHESRGHFLPSVCALCIKSVCIFLWCLKTGG